jgi:hypothetical protein
MRKFDFLFFAVYCTVKVMGAIHNGGGLAWGMGDGADWWALHFTQCWLCNHKKYTFQLFDGFLTIQVHLLFKTGHARFAMNDSLFYKFI